MARTVVAPDGRTWKVRRRLLPWLPRWRGPRARDGWEVLDAAELPGQLADVPVIGGVALVISAVLLAAGALMLVVPALVFTAETVIVGLLLLVALALRVIRRRPWTVEATATDTGERRTWSVMGWRESNPARFDTWIPPYLAGSRCQKRNGS